MLFKNNHRTKRRAPRQTTANAYYIAIGVDAYERKWPYLLVEFIDVFRRNSGTNRLNENVRIVYIIELLSNCSRLFIEMAKTTHIFMNAFKPVSNQSSASLSGNPARRLKRQWPRDFPTPN